MKIERKLYPLLSIQYLAIESSFSAPSISSGYWKTHGKYPWIWREFRVERITFPIEKEKRETRSWLAAALSATLRSARNGSPQFVRLKLCPGIPINLSPSLFPPLDPIALGPLVPRDISFGNAVERRIFTYPRVLSCTCICTRRVLPSPPPHEGMPTIF